jgi:hypothetical protein
VPGDRFWRAAFPGTAADDPEEVAPSYDDLEGPDADDSTAAARPWAAHPEGYDAYREHGHGDPLRLPATES